MSSASPAPEGYHSVTPFLNVRGAAELIGFIEQAFGGVVAERHDHADGSVMHAEVRIGDSMVMLTEVCGSNPPLPGCLYLYVPDADATYRQALASGATSTMEPADMFWGDRLAGVKDASGNHWWIAQHIEDVSVEERARRARQFAEQSASKE